MAPRRRKKAQDEEDDLPDLCDCGSPVFAEQMCQHCFGINWGLDQLDDGAKTGNFAQMLIGAVSTILSGSGARQLVGVDDLSEISDRARTAQRRRQVQPAAPAPAPAPPRRRDPFEALGLEPDATVAEIQARQQALALVFHPDRNPNKPRAATQMQAINAAVEAAVKIARQR